MPTVALTAIPEEPAQTLDELLSSTERDFENLRGIDTPPPVEHMFVDQVGMRERLAERGIRDSRTLCERLLEETGVAVLPSAAFERPADELAIRLAYVDFDGDGPLRAEGRTDDETFLRQHCPRVLEGVDTLCNWLA